MVLTKNWQKVSETYIGNTGYNDVYLRCYAKYNSQSTVNNKTNVSVESRIYVTVGSFWSSSGTYGYATVDGETYSSTANRTYYAGETVIASKTKDVYHNQDGTKSTTVSSRWSSVPWEWDVTASASVDLPSIDRYPMLVSATDFNDEGNPTITYTTNVGFENATTYAGISLDGTTDNISYRQVTISDGTYTFSLNATERNILRNATPNSNDLDVYFILKTVVGNDTYYSTPLKRKMSIINAQPTYTYNAQETVQNVITVLGSSSAENIIQNVSIVEFTMIPTALKGASIKSVRMRYGSYQETKTQSPYIFTIPVKSSNEFVFDITDTRENTLSGGITRNLISYIPVSLNTYNFKRYNPTSSNIIVNFEGNYYQQTFGSNVNTPIVSWKLENGAYTTIPNTNYVIDTTNNKIEINDYELTNALNYKNSGTFWIELSDLLTSASNNQDVLAGIPTFDYGEHDLKVNGDLYIADEDGENAVNVLNELNKIEDLLPNIEYSQTEQVVGTWTDDKPIYRKVIYVSSLPNASTMTISTGISNLDDFVCIRGTVSNGSTFFVLPSYRADDVAGIEMWIDTNNGITIKTGMDRTGYHANIILEYTKTSS